MHWCETSAFPWQAGAAASFKTMKPVRASERGTLELRGLEKRFLFLGPRDLVTYSWPAGDSLCFNQIQITEKQEEALPPRIYFGSSCIPGVCQQQPQ